MKNKILIWEIIKFVLPIAFYNSNFVISNLICYYFLKEIKDELYISAFGQSIGYYFLFGNTINSGFGEIIGIYSAKCFGANKFKLAGKYYYKTLLLLLISLLILSIFFLSIHNIFILMGMKIKLASKTAWFLKVNIPIFFSMAINNLNYSYSISQKTIYPFIIVNLFTIISLPISLNYFVNIKNRKLHGVLWSRQIQEGMNFIFIWIIMIIYSKKDTLKFRIKDLFDKKFIPFVKSSIGILLGIFWESIGVQLITILLGVKGAEKEMSIWGLILNYIDLFYFISYSMSNFARINVGYYIGEKNLLDAKSMSYYFIKIQFFIGLAISIFTIIFSYQISCFLTGIPEIQKGFNICLKIYSLFLVFDFCFPLFGTLLRLINLEYTQQTISLLSYSIFCGILVIIFIGYFNYGIYGAIVSYVLCPLLATITSFIYFFRFNWNTLDHVSFNDDSIIEKENDEKNINILKVN